MLQKVNWVRILIFFLFGVKGETLFAQKYCFSICHDRLTIVAQNGKEGIQTREGNWIIEPSLYREILPISDDDYPSATVCFLGIKSVRYDSLEIFQDENTGDLPSFYKDFIRRTEMDADLLSCDGKLLREGIRNLQYIHSLIIPSDSLNGTAYYDQGWIDFSGTGIQDSYYSIPDFTRFKKGTPLLFTANTGNFLFCPYTGIFIEQVAAASELDHGWLLSTSISMEGAIFGSESHFGYLDSGMQKFIPPVYPFFEVIYDEAQKPRSFLMEENGKKGIIDLDRKTILASHYNEIIPVQYGYILVEGGEKKMKVYTDTLYYYIDMELTPHQEVMSHEMEYYQNAKFGFADLQGKIILKPGKGKVEAKGFNVFKNNSKVITPAYYEMNSDAYASYLSRYKVSKQDWNIYQLDGKRLKGTYDSIIDVSFYSSTNYSDDARLSSLMVVGKNGRMNLLYDGKLLFPNEKLNSVLPDFSFCEGERNLFVIKGNDQGKFGFFNQRDSIHSDMIYSGMELLKKDDSDSIEENCPLIIASLGGKKKRYKREGFDLNGNVIQVEEEALVGVRYVLLDHRGKRVRPESFDTLIKVGEENNLVGRINNFYGVLGPHGEEWVPFQYTDIRVLGSDYFEVCNGGQCGLFYKNKIVIPEMYSAFDWLGENFLRVRLDYLYGVYSTETQQIILNADFDFLFRNGEFFVLGKEMLQGLSDLNGEILLQPEYEDIDVQPYGFRSGIARVIKSGKAGFFDLSNKKWITEPVLDIISNYPEANGFFRVNSGGKPVTDNYNQVYEIEGGKWGIVDTNGRQIIPVIYDAIFPFAEDAGIYKCQNPTTIDYYSADGKLLSDGASRFEKSIIGRISSRSPFKPLKISSADGPEGADATAFYMDDHSGYWLGTGSSGGVYYSADRGYSWEMRNEGLGPVHVYLLIERGDSLYVVYTSGEDRLTDQDAVSVSKVACWNSENKMWLSVYPENEEGKILNILLSMDLLREQRSREQQFPNAWKASSSGEEYFTGFNTMENLYSRSVIDTIERAGYSIPGLPHDMLFNWGGNVYSDQDKLILLSKSGLYRYGPEHIVDELSESGLIASDVTDMVASGNDYYLREGDHDIWLWNGIRFKKVFNSFEWNKSKKGKLFSRSTGVLHGDKDKVLVVVADQLLELDKNGTSRILFTGDYVPEVSESFSEYPDHFVQPQEAIRGADGKLRLLCKLIKNNVFEDGIYLLAELNESTGKLNLRSNDIFFTQFTSASLFQETKNTWLCYDQFLINPVNKDTLTLPASADVYLFGNRELICSDPSGKIYLLGDSRTLLVYDPVVKKWQKINFEGKNLRCISVDKQGNLYAAEGYQYMFYCDGTGEMYRPAKMYFSQWTNHGFEWVEQENAINTKIICIRPHHNGGLMIGTAGSGLLLGK